MLALIVATKKDKSKEFSNATLIGLFAGYKAWIADH